MDIYQDPVPLRRDEADAIRVGKSRVLFCLVVEAYKQGATPEQIAREKYTSLDLADTYAAIAYYLRHPEEVDAYLEQIDREADELQRKFEAMEPKPTFREILRARRAEMEQKHAPTGD
jgi:uncharacterized protein (DUF433 family)